LTASLFVYGTLHPDRAPASIAATVRRLIFVGPAIIRGKKLDLRHYPGLLLVPTHQDEVHGTVFLLPDDTTTLPALDAYEDFRPGDPVASLFVRQQHFVTLADGTELLCWVYVYNLNRNGHHRG
jgi:gamma-glutamylcyclotransferase (GGCT)/AIG2-like uncharacterized protein YtfP